MLRAISLKMKSSLVSIVGVPLLLLFLWINSGAEPVLEARAQAAGANSRAALLVHNGWHAAIVVRATDVVAGALPELSDFPEVEYLEISWGDAEYFPAPDAGVFAALKAALWSSGSVIHIVGFSGSIEKTYPGAEIIEIKLADDNFQKMLRFISDDFSRFTPATPAKAMPGLFPNSRFYPALSRFSLLRTCNAWIAEALRAAGLPLNPGSVFTAGNLAQQVKPYGVTRSGK